MMGLLAPLADKLDGLHDGKPGRNGTADVDRRHRAQRHACRWLSCQLRRQLREWVPGYGRAWRGGSMWSAHGERSYAAATIGGGELDPEPVPAPPFHPQD